jgi:hypothetical protein
VPFPATSLVAVDQATGRQFPMWLVAAGAAAPAGTMPVGGGGGGGGGGGRSGSGGSGSGEKNPYLVIKPFRGQMVTALAESCRVSGVNAATPPVI